MKKQLFLIVFLAFFAGITSLQAQPCVGNGFTPSAGTDYTYLVTVPNTGGYLGGGTYNWYVTQDPNILANIIPAANTFFTVNVGAGLSTYNSLVQPGSTNQLGLNWTPAAAGQVFYLVLRYSEVNPNATSGCSAENIRVWQINPNAATNFLLSIAGANPDGSIFNNANQCAAPLMGALVTGATVEYTYGINELLYRVDATGATGPWTPSVRLPNLAGLNQVYAAAEWTADMSGAGGWVAFTGAAGSTGGDFVSPSDATIIDPLVSSPILIRVQVDNQNWETLADQAINIGVDGYLPNGLSDIWGPGVWPGNPDPCDQASVFAKNATYTILARPTVNPGAGMPAFITKLP